MYFEGSQPNVAKGTVPALLDSVELLPEYRIRIDTSPAK
jgi:hypothetical protein